MTDIKTKTVPVVFNKCIVITVPLCREKAWKNVCVVPVLFPLCPVVKSRQHRAALICQTTNYHLSLSPSAYKTSFSFFLPLSLYFQTKDLPLKSPGGCSSQLLPVTTVHMSNCRRSLKARRLVTG